MPDAPGADAPALLDERARPEGGKRVFIIGLALVSAAVAFWLTQEIDPRVRPGLPLATGVALGVAIGVYFFAMRGTRVSVSAEYALLYRVQGRACALLPLRAVTAVRPVAAGLVVGVGLEIADPAQVEFPPGSGIDARRMRLWREAVGVDLVLEGFPPALAGRLDALRKAAAIPLAPAMADASILPS